MGIDIERHAYIAKLVKTLRDMIEYLTSSVGYFSIGGLVVGLCLIAMSIPYPSYLMWIVVSMAAWIGVFVAIIVISKVVRLRRYRKGIDLRGMAITVATIMAGSTAMSFLLIFLGLTEATPTTWGFGVGLFLLCTGLIMSRRSGRIKPKSLIIVGSSMIALYPLIVVAAIEWGLTRATLLELGVLLVLYVFGGFYDLRKAMEKVFEEGELEGARESERV